jgi:glycosyltransferase involved in cell wall biosynthesis
MDMLEPSADTLRLVFVGRVSAKKNLAVALEGLRDVEKPVQFDIFGPLEDPPYWSRCENLISRLPPHVTVRQRGALPPADVRPTFARYDAFLFPTLGENFGHVIAESMSASCPVICPDTTPWTSILNGGGGVLLDSPAAPAITRTVDMLASLPTHQRTELRRRAGETFEAWRRETAEVNVLARVTERLVGT